MRELNDADAVKNAVEHLQDRMNELGTSVALSKRFACDMALRSIAATEAGDPYHPVIGYHLDDKPIGLMLLRVPGAALEPDFEGAKTQGLSVEHCIADPEWKGAGRAIFENAVNLSDDLGCEGKLVLTANNRDAAVFYEQLGFARGKRADYSDEMTLVPRWRPDVWHMDEGEWRLNVQVPLQKRNLQTQDS